MKLNSVPFTLGSVMLISAALFDQVTKAVIVENASSLVYGYPVFPGFNLVFHRNEGVTFGLLNNLLGGVFRPWR